ncbi:MAG TPA: acetyl-CoA carboxylase carboxyltransferase subunit alpha [bacterium]|nr:acetyl-CoA carboxylase carboxyltransferase subunit alpha [bacterium]
MLQRILEFEKPIAELEKKIVEMKAYAIAENVELSEEISHLESRLEKLIDDTYSKLTRWQRVLLSRHPDRPYALDYIQRMFTEYVELHGDRHFGDDPAMVGGMARLDGCPVVVIGQQKGRTTKENLYRNFGMMNPEGYRRAIRLMKMAAKFKRPVVVLVDTPGAYPGLGAEERGQGEAIARNLFDMALLPVPIVVTIIGEGASGGALGIGMGDRVLMMENAWYSVISPEGCAAILWHDSTRAGAAAEELRLTAPDLLKQGVIDEIVQEPKGGAHRNHDGAAEILKRRILHHLDELRVIDGSALIDRRIDKYGKMGFYKE